MIKNIFKNKKVLITGNTGFKGSWLSIWLSYSGAKVYGSYLATAVSTTVIVGPKASQTETLYNSLTVPLVSNATSTATGGGFQCTIGPVNDRG